MYRSCNVFTIPPPIPYSKGDIVIDNQMCSTPFDPAVWGEGVWLFLHLGSLTAPDVFSPLEAQKYWSFIEGLPYMMPCQICANHAKDYVDDARADKDKICRTRESLLNFFLDFHNSVNLRTGKPPITMDQIKQLAQGPSRVSRVKYF